MRKVKINWFSRSKLKPGWIFVIVLAVIAVCLLFVDGFWFLFPLALIWAFFFVKKQFFHKLKLEDGEVVYCYGLPGSGKTMTMTRIAYDNSRERLIVANDEYRHCKLARAVISSTDLGYYDFPGAALICNDESMLDGFSARSYQSNFSDEAKTEFIVKIRQYGHAMVFTSQRENALDILLREGIISRWYICTPSHFGFCKAEMLIKESMVSEITGQPTIYYRFPTFWEWLGDPSLRLYTYKPFYGKFYDSCNPTPLPLYPYIEIED